MTINTTSSALRIMFYAIDRGWIDITPAVTTYTYHQALADSLTNFSLTVKARDPAIAGIEFLQNSLIQIGISIDGRIWYPRLYPGFLSRPEENKVFTPSGRIHEWILSGMDIGKHLIRRQVITNLAIDQGFNEYRRRLESKAINPTDGISPYEILTRILQDCFLDDPLEFDDRHNPKYWLDAETYFRDPNEQPGFYKAGLQGFGSYQQSQGTVWQLMKQFSDELFNELFIVTRLDKNDLPKTFLVFRRKPYYCSEFPNAWQDLKDQWGVYQFSSDYGIVDSFLGLSDDQVYNYWLISANTEGVNNDAFKTAMSLSRDVGPWQKVRVPILDESLLKRFNFAMYESQSQFIPMLIQTSAEDVIKDTIITATLRFFEWQCLQHKMKTGKIVVHGGAPNVHIGMAAQDIDDQSEYYVEGVDEQWSPSEGFKTTLQLTRGIPVEGEFGIKRLIQNKISSINAQGA